ncbi:MAG: SUMF1/EgtB/PvdO family nonheme iron enzyme [Actinomycetota bacterium]|nr:SUMF1/EgtB/PvdO family nonheme iron enzyme [Actinomycetota bacterium]
MSSTERLRFGNPQHLLKRNQLLLRDVWVNPEIRLVEDRYLPTHLSSAERALLMEGPVAAVDAALNTTALRQVVVLAPPGHGKSTLCSLLANRAAEDAKRTRRGWVPVRVNMRSLHACGVWESLEDLMRRVLGFEEALARELLELSATGHLWFLLDGLEEVPSDNLSALLTRLNTDLLSSANRLLVTCRTGDYMNPRQKRHIALPAIELTPFTEDHLDSYIELWHIHAEQGRTGWAEAHLQATRALIETHSDLRDMARTPLLAALLCMMGSSGRFFRQGRSAFLEQAVQYLLVRPQWREEEGEWAEGIVDDALLEPMAQRLAFDMLRGCVSDGRAHARGPVVVGSPLFEMSTEHLRAFIREELVGLDGPFADAQLERDTVNAYVDRFIGRTSTGLLQETRVDVAEFTHRTFQECLAAQYLCRRAHRSYRISLARLEDWREVFHLMAGIHQSDGRGIADLFLLIKKLLSDAETALALPNCADAESETSLGGACLAGELLDELGKRAIVIYGFGSALEPSGVTDHDPDFSGLWLRAIETIFAIYRRQDVSTEMRMRALSTVSRLGDPRFADDAASPRLVTVRAGGGYIGTVEPLPMREEKRVPSSPPVEVSVPEFLLGRFTVTNSEFEAFIDAGGYVEERWWESDEARRWRAQDPAFIAELMGVWESQKDLNFVKEFQEPEFALYSQNQTTRIARRTMKRSQPLYWQDSRFNLPTAPVVGVNWWEALAYCRWIEDQWKTRGTISESSCIDLPTEVEWEWAAGQGPSRSRRAYPWGDELEQGKCLTRHFGEPDQEPAIVRFGALPVGFYADDDQDGPADMAGNVWEWTRSPSALRGDTQMAEGADRGLEKRIVRGGSWYSRERFAGHVSFRLDDPPCNAYWDLGFRIVVRNPPPQR